MKPLVLLATLLFTYKNHTGQVLSQFTWNSNPVTTAAIGPNATSVSGSAVSSPGGVGGTNGLNAGLPTADINLTIPTGSGIFDVSGIDVSIDYQRDESVGNFFTRGSSLLITGAANLSVSYRVDNGAGGFNTVTSGNVYAIPNDNVYRTYRFVYLPTTGVGALYVNGASVWSNDGPDNRSMYWTGSGNIVIGALLDGASGNISFLDNLIIGAVTSSPLPIELLDFSVVPDDKLTAKLEWLTATEKNNDFFSLQRSTNGSDWEEFAQVKGSGTSMQRKLYSFVDEAPLPGTSYYRLKQTDYDGQYSYSPIRLLELGSETNQFTQVYPNPTEGLISIKVTHLNLAELKLYSILGQDVPLHDKILYKGEDSLILDLTDLKDGVYYIRASKSTLKIIKH